LAIVADTIPHQPTTTTSFALKIDADCVCLETGLYHVPGGPRMQAIQRAAHWARG